MSHFLTSVISKKNFPLVVICVAFFIIASTPLGFIPHPKFDSPDETAHYQAAIQVASTGQVTTPSSLPGLVSPRSHASEHGQLIPGVFLGLPIIYGTFARVLGDWVIPLLTPLISALTLLAFWVIVRIVFSDRIALISTSLLAIHPAFWYWSARGLYHNALAFDGFVISLALLLVGIRQTATVSPWKRAGLYAGSGLMMGVAIASRTSEVIWMLAPVVILAIVFWKRIGLIRGALPFCVGVILMLLPIFVANNEAYGGPLKFGYARGEGGSQTGVAAQVSLFDRARQLFFPFGINLRNTIVNSWNYGLKLFWLPALASVLGLLVHVRVKKTAREKMYLALFLLVAVWLLLYYGSWNINDRPIDDLAAIGNSHTRYWLPVYAFALPFAAGLIVNCLQRMRSVPTSGPARKVRIAWLVGAMAAPLVYTSLAAAYFSEEGLASVREHAALYRNFSDQAVQTTPPNAIIVAGRADKIFFPERSVIFQISTPEDVGVVRQLSQTNPMYVYVSPIEAPSVVKRIWEARGFAWREQIPLDDRQGLYRIENTLI